MPGSIRRGGRTIEAACTEPDAGLVNAQSRSYGQCFADISTTIDRKLDAISAHRSQLAKLDVDSSRDLARAMGRISGFSCAESYEVLRVRI